MHRGRKKRPHFAAFAQRKPYFSPETTASTTPNPHVVVFVRQHDIKPLAERLAPEGEMTLSTAANTHTAVNTQTAATTANKAMAIIKRRLQQCQNVA